MSALDDLVSLIELSAKARGADPNTLDPETFLQDLDDETIASLLEPIIDEETYLRFHRFETLFPDEGPFRRELYARHLEFFAAQKTHREVCFMAANRVGKTIAGGYSCTAHLTGRYEDWWPGYVFKHPIRCWAAGDTNETTRDIIQFELLGNVIGGPDGRKTVDGSGLIPLECIGQPKWKQGVQDFIDTVPILHRTGGWSMLGFKSFDQGRRSFQGTAKELIWLDEECPLEVYNECLMRVATTRGRLLSTYTPLLGLSPQVLQFLPKDMRPEGV